jgi:hypothetical protein
MLTEKRGSTLYATFDSVEELAGYCAQVVHPCVMENTMPQTLEWARNGHETFAEGFDAMADLPLDIASASRVSSRSVLGLVNVGEYLQGNPQCCRLRERKTSVENPIKVVVNVTISGRISSTQLLARGKCIVGLLRAVQASRPVDLYLLNEAGSPNVSVLTRVESRPFSLSQVAFAIAHPAFFRNLGHTSYQGLVGRVTGAWYSDFDGTNHADYAASVTRRLGLTDSDAYFGPLHLWDKSLDNAQAWIQREYRRIMKLSQVAE